LNGSFKTHVFEWHVYEWLICSIRMRASSFHMGSNFEWLLAFLITYPWPQDKGSLQSSISATTLNGSFEAHVLECSFETHDFEWLVCGLRTGALLNLPWGQHLCTAPLKLYSLTGSYGNHALESLWSSCFWMVPLKLIFLVD
jgi:hypothetical protein